MINTLPRGVQFFLYFWDIMRIISTVPSLTELLYDLGLRDEVVGITKFCIHPDIWYRSKTRIGGTKKLNIEKIVSLKPDLIIANKEENTKEEILSLSQDHKVHVTDIKSIEDNIDLIKTISELTQTEEKGQILMQEMRSFIHQSKKNNRKQKVLYLIWQNPMMSVGRDTFIHSMIEYCGYHNILVDTNRYPEVTEADIQSYNPDVIMLSSEPFPFKESHMDYYKSILPNAKVILVDGEAFSWYGTRVLKKADYLHSL